MKSKFFLVIGAILISVSGLVSSGTAQARNNNSEVQNRSFTELIQCGLWSGSNGDLSGRSCPSDVSNHRVENLNINQPPNPGLENSSNYVALGDSVAAGLGLPEASNASSQGSQCGRSSQAYPYIVARRLNLPLADVACSGATTGDLVTRQGISGPNPAPQLNAAFAQGTPQLITITAGANDVRWVDFLRFCYASQCDTATTTTLFDAALRVMQLKLQYALSSIEQRSNGSPPTVVLTGYYNPLSNRCAEQQGQITADEIAWIGSAVDALNQTIQNVSSNYSFVTFVPVSFRGHDICSSRPWVQGLSDPAPFHPTAKGQRTIAASIVSNLDH